MPHIIVEYSKNLEPQTDLATLLKAMHGALSQQGIDAARIKTRGIALDHAVVGESGSEGKMLHATLLLLEGRNIETKKQYGDALHATMKSAVSNNPECAVTLEIRDMTKEAYYL